MNATEQHCAGDEPATENTAKIPLTKGFFAVVDSADIEKLSQRPWYAHISRNGKYVYASCSGGRMHRIIMNPPPGMHVDHINGDTLDAAVHHFGEFANTNFRRTA